MHRRLEVEAPTQLPHPARPSPSGLDGRNSPNRARVEVLGLWWDDGFAARAATGFVDAMRHALGAYLRFAGASRLDWAPHLAADKHSSPSSPAETAATEQHPHTVPAAGLRAD
jgi:hypothetical protein